MAIARMDVPIGTVLDYAGSTVPAGYLECDGSAVSRTAYAELFAAIGTAWGAGDGSTTFNVPDMRGRAAIGAGTGTAGGATAHAFATYGGDQRMYNHAHNNQPYTTSNQWNSSDTVAAWAGGWSTVTKASQQTTRYIPFNCMHNASSGGGSQSEEEANMQPYATVRKVIRAA